MGVTRDRIGLDDTNALAFTDGITIQGDGSIANPIALRAVQHDASILGNGTIASPLKTTGATAAAAVPLVNGSGVILAPGTALFSFAANQSNKAKADALGTALCLGLAFASTPIAASGLVVVRGPLTLTTAQWDAICGTVGGLAFNTQYFLSAATAGMLSSVAPAPGSGFFSVPVLLGLSPTLGLVWPEYPFGPV